VPYVSSPGLEEEEMIPVEIRWNHRRNINGLIWDGEIHALPLVGHLISLEDGEHDSKRYEVVGVEHQLKQVACHDEQNVYIFVKAVH
jgi:hypothetical protein